MRVPRHFDLAIELDEEGLLCCVRSAVPVCHTHARSLDDVTQRIREAIELCLEVERAPA